MTVIQKDPKNIVVGRLPGAFSHASRPAAAWPQTAPRVAGKRFRCG
jgi:hypothetical protein